MFSLLISFAVLCIGYLVYGRVAEKVFAPDDRPTPAIAHGDGVDCVPMKTWKAFLVQLLNIAGTGPIFGALMGAVFGPVVFLWIVFGSILGGAVHDYMSGMISARHGGASVAELSGLYLGRVVKAIMRVFSVILLVLCGTVFVTSPAGLLDKLTSARLGGVFWAVVILIYYLLATLLPIDKLIGKLYPVFGVLLIVMAVTVIGGILFSGSTYVVPEIKRDTSIEAAMTIGGLSLVEDRFYNVHRQPVHLTPMQEQLLKLFFAAPNHSLSKQEICDSLWPRKPDASETLYTLVKRLKPVLEEQGGLQITSDRGKGYILEDM